MTTDETKDKVQTPNQQGYIKQSMERMGTGTRGMLMGGDRKMEKASS
jgi:hypothetical protein